MQRATLAALRNGVVATVVLAGIGVTMVLVTADDSGALYRNCVSVLTNALVIGYVVGIVGPNFARLAGDVERLAPLLSGDACSAMRVALADTTPRAVWTARLLGLAYGVLVNVGLLAALLSGRRDVRVYAWVLVLVPVLWAVVFPALWRLYRVSRLMYGLGRDAVRVDLDDLQPLGVFADVGVRHLLLIVIGLAFVPIQGILLGGLDALDFVPALIATLPIAIAALLLPVLGVRRSVVAAKQGELDRLGELLRRAEPHGERHLLLALRRGQIAAVPEWPFTLGSAARIAFYVIIPPCAWIAAAVVENWVSSALS
jgi:hypothetical protein